MAGRHPGALVVRAGAATADTETDSGREFYGWNQAVADTDLRGALDGVRGFYQISDERARTVVAAPLPVVVTVKGVIASACASRQPTPIPLTRCSPPSPGGASLPAAAASSPDSPKREGPDTLARPCQQSPSMLAWPC